MFGWYKNRLRNERLKLLYQNFAACEYCLDLFEANGDNRLALSFKASIDQCYNIQRKQDTGTNASTFLLELNRHLRKIYDQQKNRSLGATMAALIQRESKYSSVPSFDERFKPLQGWDNNFRDQLEDEQ